MNRVFIYLYVTKRIPSTRAYRNVVILQWRAKPQEWSKFVSGMFIPESSKCGGCRPHSPDTIHPRRPRRGAPAAGSTECTGICIISNTKFGHYRKIEVKPPGAGPIAIRGGARRGSNPLLSVENRGSRTSDRNCSAFPKISVNNAMHPAAPAGALPRRDQPNGRKIFLRNEPQGRTYRKSGWCKEGVEPPPV